MLERCDGGTRSPHLFWRFTRIKLPDPHCVCQQAELVARWGEQQAPVKAQIRQLLLATLASEVSSRLLAGQCTCWQ